jgi:ribosomal subunit interface protein
LKNLRLAPTTVLYLEKRLASAEKFIPKNGKVVCDCELAKTTEHHEKGPVFYAEVNLQINGAMYRATANAETIEAAIDIMQSNLIRELQKNKKKSLAAKRKVGTQAKEFLRKEGPKSSRK